MNECMSMQKKYFQRNLNHSSIVRKIKIKRNSKYFIYFNDSKMVTRKTQDLFITYKKRETHEIENSITNKSFLTLFFDHSLEFLHHVTTYLKKVTYFFLIFEDVYHELNFLQTSGNFLNQVIR